MQPQPQNEQRQIAIWKVMFWSLMPFLMLLFFAFEVYGTTKKIEMHRANSTIAPKDDTLKQMISELKRYNNQKSDLMALTDAWRAIDSFISAKRQQFLQFGPHQREQLETEIQIHQGEYGTLQQQIIALGIRDSQVIILRNMVLVYSALSWSQTQHEALSDSEELRLVKQQLQDKEDIRALMMASKFGVATGAIPPTSTQGANYEESEEIARLHSDIEKLRRQAIDHDKLQKKECNRAQVEAQTQLRDKLECILREKKMFASIVPEVKALIVELSQSIAKIKENLRQLP